MNQYKHNLLTRFMKYYREKGVWKTLRRMYEQPYRLLFKGQMCLYYADMNQLSESVLNLPNGITIECKKKYNEAIGSEMQRMIDYWDKENETDKVRERFEKGAILWIIKLDENIAGFGWSIRGKMVHPFYLPLTPHDAVLFSYEIFEEYRGCSLYTLLLNFIFGRLKLEGVGRAFIFVSAWNTPSIRGIEKSCFRKFCKARRFHPFGRNITIWS